NTGDQMVELKGHYMHNDVKERIYAGGMFRMNEVEEFKNLYPLSIVDVVSFRIGNQIYQGLLRFDQETLEIEGSLAESWSKSEDATEYTFKLRKGVVFHDNDCFPDGKGRELTAEDVKYCFTKLCESSGDNKLFGMFQDRVVGANEYFEASRNGSADGMSVEGIEVISDYEIKIRLLGPFAAFDKVLAHNSCWIFPKEAVEKYGAEMRTNCVGTGPFQVREIDEGKKVLLEKNPNYWEKDEFGNQLPYLDLVKITFAREKKTELLQFNKGSLDMVFKLPVEEMGTVMGSVLDAQAGKGLKYQYQAIEAFSTQYYGMLHTSPIFDDVHVRRAFNYAIDRTKLIEYTLQGEGHPAIHGFVPPMDTYDATKVIGFNLDVERAKRELALAGFPNGKGFPMVTLYFNEGGQTNTIVAEAIRKMIESNLGIKLEIKKMQFSTLIEQFTTGRCDMWRTGWVADYPDPENLLKLFYGKPVPSDPHESSFPNSHRYKNPKFDSVFEAALAEIDPERREELYIQCDQILVDDAAFLNLYYDEYIRLLGLNVRNLPQNAMEYRDLSRVFFAKEKKK
ncbi:MAG: ABC transporter substrate-binding protein, partial [Flavobacteriales bacterium]|nr:ABC transporter substrate-binding protein [Flavobacteriales bacterium]